MSFKMNFNGTDDIDASRITLTGNIPMTSGRIAGASGVRPTLFEIEREMHAAAPGAADFFNAAAASPDSANEITLSYDMEVRDGTAYSATVDEGTVVGWRLTQEGPDEPVLETTTVFARKVEIERGSDKADLTLVTSR